MSTKSGACYLKMLAAETSWNNKSNVFCDATNHKRRGNDTVITHATVQRAVLQPGLKTRQGFSYLLNSDLDQSGGLNVENIATSQGKYNKKPPWSGCSGSVFGK